MAVAIRNYAGQARVSVINRRLANNRGGLGSLAAQDATQREVEKLKREIAAANGR